jgi:methionine-rich copper-binding protein CopC
MTRVIARSLLLAVVLATAGFAAAHAQRIGGSIPSFGVLSASDALVVEFSMELEVALSRFELVPVPLSAERVPATPTAPSESERMLLNSLAARAVAAQATAAGDASPAHLLLARDPARGRTDRLTLTPQGPLPVGLYALSMTLLAVDGHTTREHFLFWVLDAP